MIMTLAAFKDINANEAAAVVQPSDSSFWGGCWLYADSPHHKILPKTPLILTLTIQPTREECFLLSLLLPLSSRLDPISVPSPLSDVNFWSLLPDLTKKKTLLNSRDGSTTRPSSLIIGMPQKSAHDPRTN
ncbi:hypothetical protein TNCV_1225431 [Trichonephila clavipes]|nr:hypothetical protein TNCV_1225431 [Trichonephila clavipes]